MEAVNLHGRESFIAGLEPTYGHHEAQESNNNTLSLVQNPIPDPIDWNKANRIDIFSYFSVENSPMNININIIH